MRCMYLFLGARALGWLVGAWRRAWVGAGLGGTWEAVDRGRLDVGEADEPLVDYVDRYDGVE